ncbi:hypothetical protein BLOT_003444 [Blomia tropicalis]|nr:hypothetical protein BLOT_003444 [Blomia tropicalis]
MNKAINLHSSVDSTTIDDNVSSLNFGTIFIFKSASASTVSQELKKCPVVGKFHLSQQTKICFDLTRLQLVSNIRFLVHQYKL